MYLWLPLTTCNTRYKTGPPAPGDGPINFFDVSGSVLTLIDEKKAKKYGFMIRFMQMTRFVERSFHLDSPEEREEWVSAYTEIKKKVMASNNVEAQAAAAAAAAAEPQVRLPSQRQRSAFKLRHEKVS